MQQNRAVELIDDGAIDIDIRVAARSGFCQVGERQKDDAAAALLDELGLLDDSVDELRRRVDALQVIDAGAGNEAVFEVERAALPDQARGCCGPNRCRSIIQSERDALTN